MIYLIFFGVIAVIGATVYMCGSDNGKNKTENDVMKETLDDVHTAKIARDKLAGDDAYVKFVRESFTRKK